MLKNCVDMFDPIENIAFYINGFIQWIKWLAYVC